MPPWSAAPWWPALARALFVAVTCTATPTAACPSATVPDLARRLGGAARHELGPELLPALLAYWRQRRGDPLAARPDGVAVFAPPAGPLLIAFRRRECLLGLLPSPKGELGRFLRERVGPVA